MSKFKGALFSLLCLLWLGSVWAESKDGAGPPGNYRVQVGDQIRLALPGEPSLATPFTVNRRGELLLPEIGAVAVVGLAPAALQQQISKQLAKVFRDLSQLRVFVEKTPATGAGPGLC